MSTPGPILITGATGLVGRQLVRHFLASGRTVIATSRSAANLAKLKSESDGTAGNLVLAECDLAAQDGPPGLIGRLAALDHHPETIVNNARNADFLKLQSDGTPGRDAWIGEFLVDVVAAYELVMAAARAPSSQLRTVVNIASMYGVVAANIHLYENPEQQSPVHYGPIKAALIHLTKELAVRFASQNIRVNAVSFGGIEGRVGEDFKARYSKLAPAGRMLDLEEVAGAVEFLATAASRGTTGHNLVVDGGWTIW